MPVKKLPGKERARMTRRAEPAEPANRTKPSKQLTERNDKPNQLKFYLPPTQHINGLKSEGNQGENSSKRSFLPGRGFYPSLSTSNHYHNTKPLVHLPGGPIGKLVMHRRNRKRYTSRVYPSPSCIITRSSTTYLGGPSRDGDLTDLPGAQVVEETDGRLSPLNSRTLRSSF